MEDCSLGTNGSKGMLPHQDPTTYVLSLAQMLENEYPLPSTSSVVSPTLEFNDEWVELAPLEEAGEATSPKKKDKKGKRKADIFSIDCEIVREAERLL